MKIFNRSLILVGLTFLFSFDVVAQWYWLNPTPQGHDLNSVQFINSSTGIAVGLNGAFIKTTNAGANWQLIHAGLDNSFNSVCFLNENTGFSTYSMIKKTTDGGLSWFVSKPNTSISYSIKFFNINTGIAGGSAFNSDSIYRTTNSGSTWESIHTHGFYNIRDIHIVNSHTGFLCSGESSINYKVRKTTNSGFSWFRTGLYTDARLYTIFFIDSLTGFTGGNKKYLYKTTDGGNKWKRILFDDIETINTISFINQNTGFFACHNDTISKIYKTTNEGLNWVEVYRDSISILKNSYSINSVFYCVGSKGRIVKTTNFGNDWISNSTCIDHGLSYHKFQNENSGYAIGSINRKYYGYSTTNGGISWTRYGTGAYLYHVFRLVGAGDNTIYAVGGYSNLSSYVAKSTDKGFSWTTLTAPTTHTIASAYFINNNTGVTCGMSGKHLKTTDGGVSWSVYSLNLPYWHSDVCLTDNNIGYSVNSGGQVWKTTNEGNTWFLVSTLGNFSLRELYFNNSNTGYVTSSQGVWKTTNGGINWYSVLSNVGGYEIEFYDLNTGYFSGYNGRIFRTTNAGQSWSEQYYITNKSIFKFYFLSSEKLFAIARGCLFRTDNGGVLLTTKNKRNTIPFSYSLYQNYPNPFNPSTKIKFDIKQSSNTKLIIYNILGKEIATLVNEKLNAGSYEVDWDGSGYPSGVYFYKLTTDGFSDVKKMILIK